MSTPGTKRTHAYLPVFGPAAARLALMALAATLVASCGSSSSSSSGGEIALDVAHPDRCDPIDTRHCLLPFPNDFFTTEDAATDTGLRVNLVRESMPTNVDGVQVDPTEWNRNDGFSPGAQIATFVAGVDLAASGVVGVGDVGGSLDADARIVLLDADTGERKPYWAELDASVSTDADRALFIRPAINLTEGHRHVVALRHLKDAAGEEIAPGDAFRALRDELHTNVPELEARRDHFERLFADLEAADVARDDLLLAWDFTVASRRNLTERVLHMRDDAFARLGSAAPTFTVASVEEEVDERIQRIVRGSYQVPKYLAGSGEPGSRLVYGAGGLPEASGTFSAKFVCLVPRAAISDPEGGVAVEARASLYGHGLLGSAEEVDAGNIRDMANEHNFVFCATDWLGMSEDDVGNAITILGDLSHFPTLADRAQQGFVNFLYLGRLMIHAQGLVTDPAFQDQGRPVIDRSALFYDGNSQGGIMGGALTALATDFTRAVLGVPAMNYSTLLQRSVDWETYRLVYDPAYPDELERGLGLILIQMLWDRGEANGYAHHMTSDPLPGTPAHEVLMHVAFGDWQVSPAAADVEARTIGARIHVPTITEGRLPGYVTPYWGLEPIESYPYQGSAMIVFDSGAPAPPMVNLAPSEGRDPHGDPRAYVEARRQKSEFLRAGGAVIDVCAGAPCIAPERD